MTKNRRVGGFFLPASFAAEERRIQPVVRPSSALGTVCAARWTRRSSRRVTKRGKWRVTKGRGDPPVEPADDEERGAADDEERKARITRGEAGRPAVEPVPGL